MRARVSKTGKPVASVPPPNAHSLLDASAYNVAQAAVPKWLLALLGPLALMGGASADQNQYNGIWRFKQTTEGGLLRPAEGPLRNAGLMYNVEMLHNLPPTTGSPAYEGNIKEWEAIARLPDDQQNDAIKYWQPNRVDPPKYIVSKQGKELNQNFFKAFEAMAEAVVHNDVVAYSNKVTPDSMNKEVLALSMGKYSKAEISASVTASMDQVDKYLSFLDQPEYQGHKEFFQTDWSKRAQGSHERKERQTQIEFVVNVAENTQEHFSDPRILFAGDYSKHLDAQTKATESLRKVRRLVDLVLVDTHMTVNNHLSPSGYNNLDKTDKDRYSRGPDGPEKDILDRIDKLLVPKKDRLGTYADEVERRQDLQLARAFAKAKAKSENGFLP